MKLLPLPKSCAWTWFIRREHLPEKLVSTSCPCCFSGIGGMSSEVLESTFPLDERRHQVLVFWKVGLLLASIRIHGCPSRAADVHPEPRMSVWIHGCPFRAMDTHLEPWMPIQICDHPTPASRCSKESHLSSSQHPGSLVPF